MAAPPSPAAPALPEPTGTHPTPATADELSWRWRWQPVGRSRLIAGFALAAVGPAATTLVLAWQPNLGGLSTQTLLMLAVTVATALVGGLFPAVAAALLGGVLLNVLFVEPVGRLQIADPRQAVAIGMFLLIGVSVALVVDLAARQAERARRARTEAAALADLARRLLVAGGDLASLLAETGQLFDRTGAAIWRTEGGNSFVLEAGWGQAPDPTAPGTISTAIDRDAALVLPGPDLPSARRSLLTAYAAHLRVIRDRARADRQAVAASALEQGNRTRTALLAAVSHDLRTPLAAIKAASGSLRSTDVTWSERDRAELLATIEEGSDRMGRLVENLLDKTRLDTGTMPVLLEDVDIGVVLDAVRRDAGDAAGARRRVGVEVAPDPLVALADAGLLERVVANLVENALRYTVGPVQIRAAAQRDGRVASVRVEVIDRGVGVSQQDRPQLFQPFRRLGDAPDGEGLGLGLAVSHGLIEAMNGTLTVGETPGGGLTMQLELPAAGEPS